MDRRHLVARLALLPIALLAVLAPVTVSRVAAAASAQEVEAAYLFNFARYVEWPDASFEGKDSPIRVCMLWADDFASLVDSAIGSRMVDKRPVSVEMKSSIGQTGRCHILFVGEASREQQQMVIAALSGESVFTVSEARGFASRGGVANFIQHKSKVRFEISPEAAAEAGLKISSRLLQIAKVVER